MMSSMMIIINITSDSISNNIYHIIISLSISTNIIYTHLILPLPLFQLYYLPSTILHTSISPNIISTLLSQITLLSDI